MYRQRYLLTHTYAESIRRVYSTIPESRSNCPPDTQPDRPMDTFRVQVTEDLSRLGNTKSYYYRHSYHQAAEKERNGTRLFVDRPVSSFCSGLFSGVRTAVAKLY